MQNINVKKGAQKWVAHKSRRTNLRALSRIKGIPAFMLRIAQEQHVKIFPEQIIPKYRHD